MISLTSLEWHVLMSSQLSKVGSPPLVEHSYPNLYILACFVPTKNWNKLGNINNLAKYSHVSKVNCVFRIIKADNTNLPGAKFNEK